MIVQTPHGPHVMNFLCFLTFLTFIFIFGLIIWEKISRMYLALFGALVVIVMGVFNIQEAVNIVSWETIGFLLGMFILIEILSESGFFRWVSMILAKKLNYAPLKILVFFPLLSFVLSAFIDSITVMLFLSVITFELSRLLKFDPVPVVISEVVLANIGGAGTLMGDPPNVILGTVLGFNLGDFLINNGPITIIAGMAAIGVSYLMNKKHFVQLNPDAQLKELKNITSDSQIKDRFLFLCGMAGMGVTLFLLLGRSLLEKKGISVNISTASLLPAFIILTFGGKRVYKHSFLRKIDAETLLFFIGLFILVGALEKRFIIQMSANFLGTLFNSTSGFIGSIFWGTAITSAFVDNVPLSMAMTYIIKQNVINQMVPGIGIMVWATSLGVDLGGNLTPIGASANVVAYSYMEKSGNKIGWLRWLKLALPQGLTALIISYLGILIKLKLGFF